MRKIVKGISLIVLVVLLAGCMLFNPNKRTDLGEMSYPGVFRAEKPVIIKLKMVSSQMPFEEAVWTNYGGPFYVKEESRTIGFTQNYQFVPLLTGGTVVNTGSVLVVPFGRIFAETLHAAFEKSSKGSVCVTQSCLTESVTIYPDHSLVAIEIRHFRPLETPMNHINYQAEIGISCLPADGPLVEKVVTAEETNVKLGHMFQTGYSFTANMRDSAKQFGIKAVDLVLSEASVCFR